MARKPKYEPEGSIRGEWDYLLFYFGHGGYPDEMQYRRNIKNPDVIEVRSECAVQTTAYRGERTWDRLDEDQFTRLWVWMKEMTGQRREIFNRADDDWIRFWAWMPANRERFEKDRADAMKSTGQRPYAFWDGIDF